MPLQRFFHEYDPALTVSQVEPFATGLRGLVHTRDGKVQPLEVRFFQEGTVRITLGDPALNTPVPELAALPEENVVLVEGPEVVELVGAELRFRLNVKAFHLHLERLDGTILWRSSQDDMDQKGRPRVLPLGFLEVRSLGLQNQVLTDLTLAASFEVDPLEHFYGLGEKFTRLDKHGLTICSANSNAGGATSELAYKNVPFVLSSKGYGVFFNTSAHLQHEIANPTLSVLSYVVAVDAPCLELYLFNGPTPREVLKRYTALTGRAPKPPLWSFGLWISRFYYESQETLLRVAREVRAQDIPADVINTDTYWMQGQALSDMQWDRGRFPEPKAMINELSAMGFKLCLWEYPYLSLDSPLFAEAWSKGYLCKRPDGLPATAQTTLPVPTHDRPGFRGVGTVGNVYHQRLVTPGALIDFTHPGAVRWWQALHRERLEEGVAVFKCDFGEDVPLEAQFHNGLTGRQMHNIYPLYYQKAVFEVTKEVRGEGLIWGRSGWAGGQRYPVHWGGDPVCTFSAMAATLRAGLSYGLSGVPFWSHDIGGFAGTPSPELYIRWAQFGLLSSHARIHGTTPREPWEFGPDALSIFRRYAHFRYRLLPYLWFLAHQAAEEGLPLMRAMLLEFPHDPTAYFIDSQYMLGPDLLVAPVLSPGGQVRVYLPAGRWLNYWSGRIEEGGRWIERVVPLEEIPLFLREGAVLPQVESAAHTGLQRFDRAILEFFGPSERRFPWPGGGEVRFRAAPAEYGYRVRLSGTPHRFSLRPRGCTLQGVRLVDGLGEVALGSDQVDVEPKGEVELLLLTR